MNKPFHSGLAGLVYINFLHPS